MKRAIAIAAVLSCFGFPAFAQGEPARWAYASPTPEPPQSESTDATVEGKEEKGKEKTTPDPTDPAPEGGDGVDN